MNKRDTMWAERRAAEIVASMVAGNGWPSTILGLEMAGWMRAGDKRERGGEDSREWQAGYLAAHIWYETTCDQDVLTPLALTPDQT